MTQLFKMKSAGDIISCHVKTALEEHAVFCRFYLFRRWRMFGFLDVCLKVTEFCPQVCQRIQFKICARGKLAIARFS